MAAITFASRLDENGTFTIPKEAVDGLGLHAGDAILVRIEADLESNIEDAADQAELHRRATVLFEEMDRTVRESGKPLSDPLEAAWGAGVEEKARRMGLKL